MSKLYAVGAALTLAIIMFLLYGSCRDAAIAGECDAAGYPSHKSTFEFPAIWQFKGYCYRRVGGTDEMLRLAP